MTRDPRAEVDKALKEMFRDGPHEHGYQINHMNAACTVQAQLEEGFDGLDGLKAAVAEAYDEQAGEAA